VKNINVVFGKGLTKFRTTQYWYQHFNNDDENCKSESRSGRPIEIDKHADWREISYLVNSFCYKHLKSAQNTHEFSVYSNILHIYYI